MSQASNDFHEIEAVLRRGWVRPIATPPEFDLAAIAIASLRRERDHYRTIANSTLHQDSDSEGGELE